MTSLNRIVMQQTSRAWLEALPLSEMDAAEISGKNGRRYPFRSYERFRFPKYDICKGPFEDADGLVHKFDIVLANQVWEHLDRPYAATKNVLRMLRVGGGISGSRCHFSSATTARLWIVHGGARVG